MDFGVPSLIRRFSGTVRIERLTITPASDMAAAVKVAVADGTRVRPFGLVMPVVSASELRRLISGAADRI